MYEFYSVSCRGRSTNGCCYNDIQLPGNSIFTPESESSNSSHVAKWPPDNWKANIACSDCGNILEYTASDVEFWHEEKEWDSDPYFYVRTECYLRSCRSKVEFYIVEPSELTKEWFENPFESEVWIASVDWVKEVRDGRFRGCCPNGHEINQVPLDRYRVEKERGLLPSLTDRFSWGRNVPEKVEIHSASVAGPAKSTKVVIVQQTSNTLPKKRDWDYVLVCSNPSSKNLPKRS